MRAAACHATSCSLLHSVEAAVQISRHTVDLVSEGSSTREVVAQNLYRISALALSIVVLQGLDRIGPSLGVQSVAAAPMIWFLFSVSGACAALSILYIAKKWMNKSKGEFILRHDVNVRVRMSAFRQWLRKQHPLQVCMKMLYTLNTPNILTCFQESLRGTRARQQVRITQASMLRDYGCSLTCVYETASQRLWQVDIRGSKSAKTVENTKFERLLVANLMELLEHAGNCNFHFVDKLFPSVVAHAIVFRCVDHRRTGCKCAKGDCSREEGWCERSWS